MSALDLLIARLAEPGLLAGHVMAKVQMQTRDKTRGMLVGYIDARVVAEALDEIIGPSNWDSAALDIPRALEAPDDKGILQVKGYSARVRLTIRDESGLAKATREDVGWNAQAGRGDPGTAIKGAVSDGLKRAAVQFGVGRALYSLPTHWIGTNEWGDPLDQAEVTAVEAEWNSVLSGGAPVATPATRPAPERSGEPASAAAPAPGAAAPRFQTGGGGRPMSPAQGKLIEKLLGEKEGALAAVREKCAEENIDNADWTALVSPAASKLIDTLIGLPAAGDELARSGGHSRADGDDIPF